jgi:hypothetical protein
MALLVLLAVGLGSLGVCLFLLLALLHQRLLVLLGALVLVLIVGVRVALGNGLRGHPEEKGEQEVRQDLFHAAHRLRSRWRNSTPARRALPFKWLEAILVRPFS